MSSTNKTANLNLHSWVRTDPVVCEDFNENFSKLDAAVGTLRATRGNCQIYTGSYAGTGSKVHSLTFPKLPILIFIQRDAKTTMFYGGFVMDGAEFYGPNSNSYKDRLTVSGTTVTFNETGTGESGVFNQSEKTYHYAALAPLQ